MAVSGLISLLILVVFLVLVCIVAKWFIDYMQFPHPIGLVMLVLVGLLCLLLFLQAALGGGLPTLRWR